MNHVLRRPAQAPTPEEQFRALSEKRLERLLEALADTRALVLDVTELAMREAPEWKAVRSRLLRFLGERGLEERIVNIMSASLN